MIRCPTCGTINQDSRRTCTQCGNALPQTKIRCPNCGALNPVGNILCDRCNARLIKPDDVIPPHAPPTPEESKGAPAVKGISLPVRPSSAHDTPALTDDLPDWLKDLPEDEEIGVSDELADETEPETQQYPEWLRGLLDDNPEFGDSESDEPAEETGPGLSLESDSLPDWLAGTGAPEAPSSADLPDWLTSLGGEGSEEVDIEALPDWLTTSSDEVATEESDQELAGSLPDWLRSSAEEGVSAAEPAAAVPDWLSALDVTPQSQESQPGEDEHAELRPASQSTKRQVTEPAPPPTDQALIFSESELPDWLAEARGLALEEGAGVEPSTEDTSEPERAEAKEPVELPDWLTNLALEEGEEASQPERLTGDDTDVFSPELEVTAEADSDLPPSEPPGELPDWLADLDVAPAEGEKPSVFVEAAPAGGDEVRLAPDSPTWLREIPGAPEAPQATSGTPVFLDEESPQPDEETLQPSPEESHEPLPSWLQDLDLTAPAEPDRDVAPSEEEMLARANLPAWLQELAPPEVGHAAEGAPLAAGLADLAPADIPDWVQALRPEVHVEGKARHERGPLPTPAEPAGPLEGIAGVLTPLTIVDVPLELEPTLDIAVPEAVVAQAQLWQKLLEQPRSAARPVAQMRPYSRQATWLARLVVAVVIIVGVFAAFWVLPEGFQLSQIDPIQIAPGVSALVSTIDQLQTGDRVIVAVEYPPAYAEEMSQVALPILEHLAAREAEVVFVSSLPEGGTLGATLSARVPGLTTTTSSALAATGGYVAGNANGIAAYLARPDTQSARHLLVLAAQPEHLRWWIEQNAVADRDGLSPLPLSVGVSAATGRLVVPYLQAEAVQGWVMGYPEALAYRDISGAATPGAYRQVLDILMLAHWAAAALLAFGMLYNLAAGKKGTR